jgi:hypothetical protein
MRSFVPLHHVRRNFALRKFAHAASQLLLLSRKRKIHDALSL